MEIPHGQTHSMKRVMLYCQIGLPCVFVFVSIICDFANNCFAYHCFQHWFVLF